MLQTALALRLQNIREQTTIYTHAFYYVGDEK